MNITCHLKMVIAEPKRAVPLEAHVCRVVEWENPL